MKDSMLLQTLQVFSKNELIQLGQFLESPFFNPGRHHRRNIALFDLLKEIIIKEDFEKLNKQLISQKLFATKKGETAGYLNNLMSELMAAIRKFITWQEVNGNWDNIIEGIACSKFYKTKGLIKLQERTILKTKRAAQKKPFFLEKNPIIRYWLELGIFNLESLRNQRKGDLNIPPTIESLSIFYVTKLLEIALYQVQQNRLVADFNPTWSVMLEHLRQIFYAYDFFGDSAALLLNEALTLMIDKTKSPFDQLQKFVELLNEHKEKISTVVLRDLAAYARNYCTWKINEGYTEFFDFRLNLYKEHLVNGWLYEDGKLIPSTFINMMNIGLWLEETEWVEHLLLNYVKKINTNNQERIFHYGYALFFLHTRQIEEARTHLIKMFQTKKFGDVDLENYTRVLEIKICYEEGEEEFFICIQNFRMFLSHNKNTFNKTSLERKRKFIQAVNIMAKLKQQVSQKVINEIDFFNGIKKIEEEFIIPILPIAERRWLIGKLKELKTFNKK